MHLLIFSFHISLVACDRPPTMLPTYPLFGDETTSRNDPMLAREKVLKRTGKNPRSFLKLLHIYYIINIA